MTTTTKNRKKEWEKMPTKCVECGRDLYTWEEFKQRAMEAVAQFIVETEHLEKPEEEKKRYFTATSHEQEWWPEFMRWLIMRERVDMKAFMEVLDQFQIRLTIVVPNFGPRPGDEDEENGIKH